MANIKKIKIGNTSYDVYDYSALHSIPVATSSALGGVKSGTDITVDSSGNVSVVDDSHNHVISNIDDLQTTLNAKAPLASPALTGTPTAPTAAAGTNTTQVATTAFVQSAAAGSTTKYYTATLATGTWTGSASPYTYTLSVSGLKATNPPIIHPNSTTAAVVAAYGRIYDAEATSGQIVFSASAKPSVDIPVIITDQL